MPSPLETDKAGVGETLADVAKGLALFLILIAFDLTLIGVFGS